MNLLDKIGYALYGNCCMLCGDVLDIESEHEVCGECDMLLRSHLQNQAIVINDISISADKFLFSYNNKLLRHLVLEMKDDPLKKYCSYFARIASECIEKDPAFSDFDIVTYCPRKPSKARIIGYDHSCLFAEYISRFTGKSFMQLLKRREGGKEQKKVKRINDRIENIQNKFYFNNECNCKGKTVLMVDDIITSGSTAKECARILKKAGAARVLALFILD